MGVLDFELFNLKDMWKKVKDNPEQLLLGAADPLGAALWGGILGKDYDPLVNVLGGPKGGGTLGVGSGGVYDRAEAAGINTSGAMGIHDLAEVVAGSYAGAAGVDALGGLGAGSGGGGFGSPLGSSGGPAIGNLAGGPGASTGITSSGTTLANTLPVSGGGAGFDWGQFAQNNLSNMSQQQQQQQQQPPSVPGLQRRPQTSLQIGDGSQQQQQIQQRRAQALAQALQQLNRRV